VLIVEGSEEEVRVRAEKERPGSKKFPLEVEHEKALARFSLVGLWAWRRWPTSTVHTQLEE